jgi:hypothetical protein
VLGAWGCGAFGNDPHQRAEEFRAALVDEFAGAFREVLVAISDWSPERRFEGRQRRHLAHLVPLDVTRLSLDDDDRAARGRRGALAAPCHQRNSRVALTTKLRFSTMGNPRVRVVRPSL